LAKRTRQTKGTRGTDDFDRCRVPADSPQFNSRERLPALDGLRGVAILLVFFYHYAGGLPARVGSGPIHALGIVFAFGWSGVDLFFVLSGFLITGILYDTQMDPRYYRNFYARRVLRIFPPFYFLALVLVVLTPILGIHWKFAHLAFLFYIGFPCALIWPAVMQISPLVLTNHLWSLCAEEQFYAIWPAMIARLRNRSAILWACAAAAILALFFRIAICASGWLSIGWTHDFLLARMDTLALGAAIALLMRGPRPEKVLRRGRPLFIVGCGATIALCAVRRTVNHIDPFLATAGFSVIALMYGGLLLLALRSGGWVETILSFKALRIFGRYSYGMYLYDLPLTILLSPRRDLLISRFHSYAMGSAVFLILCLLVNLLVAAASFHFLEAPLMRFKSRFRYASS
jgi:peptidoglycan/LPS O-acetylase OafA/YrhL